MLGTRTSRPHPSDSTLFRISKRTGFFALRAQWGRDVRVPSNELTDFLGKAGRGRDRVISTQLPACHGQRFRTMLQTVQTEFLGKDTTLVQLEPEVRAALRVIKLVIG